MKVKYFWIIPIGLVIILILPLLMPGQGHGNHFQHQTKTRLELIATALEEYRKDNGHYPSTSDGLKALLLPGKKYLSDESAFIDSWGNRLVYFSPAPYKVKDTFLMYSIGPNKIDNQGKNDDIVCCTR